MNIRYFFIMTAAMAFVFNADPVLAQNATQPDAAAAVAEPSQKADDFEYKIGAENVLLVDLCSPKGDKISQRVQVTSEGNITLPFVGEVAVAGLTVPEVQRKLKGLLNKEDFGSLQVIIFVEEYSKVTIMGEVRKSGAFPIKGRLNVIELIAMAEGFSEIASPNEVKVIHTNPDGTKQERVVRVYDIMNSISNGYESLFLRPGDVVIVPSSTVTIMGEVNKPGVYPTKGRLTTIELIALAEGFSKFATRNDVKVVHTNPDGTKEKSIVRVQDMMNSGSGGNENLLLRSGDVVIVP